MKIVMPLAGKGTRLLPHTEYIPKPLMFVAGKTILDYLMDELIPLNPTEFVFIVGYRQEEMKAYLTQKYPHISMNFIEQPDPQGLGHAIYQARDAFAKDEEMLVILGDQTFTIDWEQMLQSSVNRISVVEVENPSSFGVVTVDNNNFITEMEEKPQHPKSNLAISGVYYFPSAQTVFSAIAHQIAKDIRTRGEIQITDSMRIMMDLGEKFSTQKITDWNDCGNHKDLIEANHTLLQKHSTATGSIDTTVTIHQPVWIHPSAVIKNSVIGPNVAIAQDVNICDSKLKHTIIDQNTTLSNSDICNSYIGSNLELKSISGSGYFLA